MEREKERGERDKERNRERADSFEFARLRLCEDARVCACSLLLPLWSPGLRPGGGRGFSCSVQCVKPTYILMVLVLCPQHTRQVSLS